MFDLSLPLLILVIHNTIFYRFQETVQRLVKVYLMFFINASLFNVSK